jgi:hypothetical protein
LSSWAAGGPPDEHPEETVAAMRSAHRLFVEQALDALP